MNWEENVRKVTPYVPGEQPDDINVIKLNTNECPYPPAPGIKEKAESFEYGRLRLYPDTEAGKLADALCEYYSIGPEQLFIGVGSDENGGIIIPNPNAPTGLAEPLKALEDIIASNPGSVVIIDEAYVDFGGESCLPLIDKYDNLLVVQTFSKSRALAGLRIGFAMGNPRLIGYLKDAKFSFNSYTMNMLSVELGAEAVRNADYFKDTVNKIIATRERIKGELLELGFTFPDSKANFIFASHEKIPAKIIFQELRKRGIYVRYWEKPRIDNALRITIGTDEQMDVLIKNLKEIIEKE